MQDQSEDEEGQHTDRTHNEGEQGSGISQNGSQGPNKLVSIIGPSLQRLIDAMSVIFGPDLRKTKEKNVWSKQIMKELVEGIAQSRYRCNGMSPGLDHEKEKRLVDSISTTEDIPITDPAVIYPIKTEETVKDIAKNDQKSTVTDDNNTASKEGEAQEGGNKEGEAQEGGNKEAEAQKGAKIETEAQRQEREALKSIAKKETPILVAARNGVIEIVKEVLDKFKIAIHDSNIDNKNMVLLAAENRRGEVYDYLHRTTKDMKERIFCQSDNDGNSALHLAAKLNDDAETWPVPGAALQMQCEVKWYEFVKGSMPQHFFRWYNDNNETPEDLFNTSHKNIVNEGGVWLNKTSESFSLVATLIATVAFATSAIVPGGVNEDNGSPNLEDKPAFSIFAISSLVALCASIICVMLFLAILTSSYKDMEFGKDLPRKFLIGLTSMFVSTTSMLISFCAGHSFVIKEELKYAALPVYAVTCLVVTIVTIAQFPFYFDLVKITFSKKPWGVNIMQFRSYFDRVKKITFIKKACNKK